MLNIRFLSLNTGIALIVLTIFLLSVSCDSGYVRTEEQLGLRDSLIHYIDSVIDNKGVVFEGKEIHVQVLIDTLDPGNEEEWNLLNAKLAIQLSTHLQLGKYLIDSTFFLVIRRADNFTAPNYLYVQQFALHDFTLMRDSIHHPIKTVKRIDFLTANISADEYHETWLLLRQFRNDSVFLSTDSLFSSVFLGCEYGWEKQCADLETIQNFAKNIAADTAWSTYIKLDQHLEALKSVK